MAETKEIVFWNWFQANSTMLFEFERDQERIFDLLQAEIQKVDPRLTFEFGPVRDKRWREFVISADGLKDAFPAVESLFAQAPELDHWKFVKFRPRRSPMKVCVQGRCVEPDDIHFRLFRDGDKIGILLFFEGFDVRERVFYAQIGYLMLDQSLGEYMVETEVGFIDYADRTSKYFDERLVLPILASEFDHALIQK